MCKLSIFVNFSSTQLLSPPALWRFGCSPVICKSPEVGVTIGSENKLCVVSESSHLPGSETYCNAGYLFPVDCVETGFSLFYIECPLRFVGHGVHMDLVTEQSSSKNSWGGATSEETGKNLTTARCPVSWRAPPAARQPASTLALGGVALEALPLIASLCMTASWQGILPFVFPPVQMAC